MHSGPLFIMMIGVPHSGKTTVRKELINSVFSQSEVVVLSTDDYIEEVALNKNLTYNEVFKETINEATSWLNRQFDLAVQHKKNIILDQTNLTQNARRKKLSRIPKEYSLWAVDCMVHDIETHNKQIESVPMGRRIPFPLIESMRGNYQPPLYTEGFDFIHTINPISKKE